MSRTRSAPSTTATRHVDSDWWQVVALAGAFFVLAYVAGVFLFGGVVLSFLVGAGGGPPELFVGSVGVLFLVVLAMVLVGLVLSLLLPIALYYDAEAVAAADVGWDPDPTLYAIAGVVGLFAQGVPVQPAVAFYYLYKRHEAVGTP
jgi:hypothetical protein